MSVRGGDAFIVLCVLSDLKSLGHYLSSDAWGTKMVERLSKDARSLLPAEFAAIALYGDETHADIQGSMDRTQSQREQP